MSGGSQRDIRIKLNTYLLRQLQPTYASLMIRYWLIFIQSSSSMRGPGIDLTTSTTVSTLHLELSLPKRGFDARYRKGETEYMKREEKITI